jgi:hypothetical protein
MTPTDLGRTVWHAPFSLVAEMRSDGKLAKLKSLCVYYALCAERVDRFVEVGGVKSKRLQAAMTVIWQAMREEGEGIVLVLPLRKKTARAKSLSLGITRTVS